MAQEVGGARLPEPVGVIPRHPVLDMLVQQVVAGVPDLGIQAQRRTAVEIPPVGAPLPHQALEGLQEAGVQARLKTRGEGAPVRTQRLVALGLGEPSKDGVVPIRRPTDGTYKNSYNRCFNRHLSFAVFLYSSLTSASVLT